MIDLNGVSHNQTLEELTTVICNKTQNTDRKFFRTSIAYFLGVIASTMRVNIETKDRGNIPVNVYGVSLAPSGTGKNFSVNIMENDILSGFRDMFIETTLPEIAERNLSTIAHNRALKYGTDVDEEFDKASKEYNATGAYVFTFSEGTAPAVKQLRHKLLMAEIGSVNLAIDEIGSNLLNSNELLTLFLELYDLGITKPKITKSTADNKRAEEIFGRSPTNMLLFGTPSKLLDGGKTEDEFFALLETGYARRCLFAWGDINCKVDNDLTPQEVYDLLTSTVNDQTVARWHRHFQLLAGIDKYNWQLTMEDDVAVKLIEYKMQCEKAAEELPEHEEVRKAELSHRYFKAMKLAGAYAFVEQEQEISMDHLLQAILLTEESGEAFEKVLTREKPHVRLCKYLASIDTEATHADLQDALPFYKGSASARNEMLTLARAWGYKEHIIIKNRYVDDVELFSAESLKNTNLDELIVSYSNHFAENYEPDLAPFDQLETLLQLPNMNWCNHQFKDNYRREANAVANFNTLVLDIDGGVDMNTAHNLLKDYVHIIQTTKRHTDDNHRFRLIMPINYELHLDADEYVEFMQSVCLWFPFDVDESANQRSRKWLTNEDAIIIRNDDGELLDALNFIPRTAKNDQYISEYTKLESLDNLERWFAKQMTTGNRNNQMIKFALALVDAGFELMEVGNKIKSFNAKLSNPLTENEIDSTVMRTVAKRYTI